MGLRRKDNALSFVMRPLGRSSSPLVMPEDHIGLIDVLLEKSSGGVLPKACDVQAPHSRATNRTAGSSTDAL